ncbi:hypothetical protein [Methylosinus sp. LW3]|uniref:hypothetical protein n=1 Tax=Methylosinus sp. LW3 TaxID=107635 RepID=UPI0012FAE218|nr:hypothetical protein [Methylosinus sp. LW3]
MGYDAISLGDGRDGRQQSDRLFRRNFEPNDIGDRIGRQIRPIDYPELPAAIVAFCVSYRFLALIPGLRRIAFPRGARIGAGSIADFADGEHDERFEFAPLVISGERDAEGADAVGIQLRHISQKLPASFRQGPITVAEANGADIDIAFFRRRWGAPRGRRPEKDHDERC